MDTSSLTGRRGWRRLFAFAAVTIVAGAQLAVPVVAAPNPTSGSHAAARDAILNPTSTIHLDVHAARTEPRADGGNGVTEGDPIAVFKWMVNLDNTGTTTQRNPNAGGGCSTSDAGYPDSCKWASIAGLASSAPVVAQGDETTFPAAGLTLDPGRYLVSVLADGYKLDGTPFTIPMETPGVVVVPLQPLPLPTATIKAQVFADVTEANGQYDPGEDGLSGFAGKITDYLGQVNTDVFGNPLCTTYASTDANGNGIQDPGEIDLSGPDYEPTLVHLGGKCLSGDINMDGVVNGADTSLYNSLGLDPSPGPGRPDDPEPRAEPLRAVGRPADGPSWIQTTTLEGNHDWDAWVMEGSTGLDTEFVVAGEPFPATIFGYLPGPTDSYWPRTTTGSQRGRHGTIKGVVDAMRHLHPAEGRARPADTRLHRRQDRPPDRRRRGSRCPTWTTATRRSASAGGNPTGRFDDRQRPRRQLHAHLLGRAAELHPRLQNVTVSDGETVDMGILPLTGWWTELRRLRLQRHQPQRRA